MLPLLFLLLLLLLRLRGFFLNLLGLPLRFGRGLPALFRLLLIGGFGCCLPLDDGCRGGFLAAAAGGEDERQGGERGCGGADGGWHAA